jgi:hypothetical protein
MPNQPTDTPRTDAVFYRFHTHDDIVALARDLERELNAMTRDAMCTARDRDEWMVRSMRLSSQPQ